MATEMQRLRGDVSEYLLAGNATVTVRSSVTGKRYTYKLKQSKDNEMLYFIHLLRGQNNEEDYRYIGCYYKDTCVFHPCKTWRYAQYADWPSSLKAIEYTLKNMHKIPDKLLVYHEGKCCRCGRKLTTPESIMTGIGPECRRLNYGQL